MATYPKGVVREMQDLMRGLNPHVDLTPTEVVAISDILRVADARKFPSARILTLVKR